MTDITDAAQRQLIVFRVGERDLGVPIMAVREIRAFTPATPLPHVPRHVLGVINLRGAVLPVIDLSERLGWGQAQAGPRHVIVVVQIAGRMQGLLVDAVSDIVRLEGELQPAPDVAAGGATPYLEGLLAADTRMILVLALDRLAVEPAPTLAEAA